MKGVGSVDIEELLEAAAQHGRDDSPDHEVGDLQGLLRAICQAMSKAELKSFLVSGGDAHQLLAEAKVEDIADVAAPRNVEVLISGAQAHGEDGEPDMEAGDLQQFVRLAWSALTPEGRNVVGGSREVFDLLEVRALGATPRR